MQEKLNLRAANKVLLRILIVSLIVFIGAIYQIYASSFQGFTGLTISGNLYVTSTLTVGTSEGAAASGALILWDGTTCPTSWTDVSSTYANRFPLGGSSLLNSGSNDHSHTTSHSHGSTFGLSSEDHAHTYGGSDDTVSPSHTTTGCNLRGESCFGTCYTVQSQSVSSSHSHGGWSGNTGTADSHSHTVSGSTGGPNSASGTENHIPSYRTLKLCKKG